MQIVRGLFAIWYFLFWLVAVFKWIPITAAEYIKDDMIITIVTIGLAVTLLIPIYFILQKKV